jgi:hypothetical protein
MLLGLQTALLVISAGFFAGGVWLYQRADRVRADGMRDSKNLVAENLAASARERETLIERMAELADKPLAPPAGSRRRPVDEEAEQLERAWRNLEPAGAGLMDDVPVPVDWGVE